MRDAPLPLPLALAGREQQQLNRSRATSEAAALSRALAPRLGLDRLLVGHRGCVNHLQFNQSGSLLVSGSDDLHLCLWDLTSGVPVLRYDTGHAANIFCCKWMPGTGDTSEPLVATCAGDGLVRLHNLSTLALLRSDSSHTGRVKKLVTEPGNPSLILSCSEDGTVRHLDTRSARSDQLLRLSRNGVSLEVNSISSPWHKPWLLAAGAADEQLRVFDRRKACGEVSRFSPAPWAPAFASDCISGVAFSDDGSEVLGNYLGDHVYLFSLADASVRPLGSSSGTGSGRGAGACGSGGGAKRTRAAAADMAGAGAAGGQSPVRPPPQHRRASRAAAGDGHVVAVEGGAAAAAAAAGVPQAMDVSEDADHMAAAEAAGPASPPQQASGGSSDRAGAVPAAAAAAEEQPGRWPLSIDEAVERLEHGRPLCIPASRHRAVAAAVLNRSEDLFERGEVEASLRFARAALLLRPEFGLARYHCAVCLERQGRLEEALAEAEQALQTSWGYDLQQFVRRLRRRVGSGRAAQPAGDTPPSPPPAAAAAAAAAAAGGGASLAAAAGGASGDSEPWSPSGSGRSSSSSDSSGQPGSGGLPSDDVDTDGLSGGAPVHSGSSNGGDGSSSEDGGSSSSHGPEDDADMTSDDDSWSLDEAALLGLDDAHEWFEWGFGDPPRQQQQQLDAGAAAPMHSTQQQQQPGQGAGSSSRDATRFRQLVAPLRNNLCAASLSSCHGVHGVLQKCCNVALAGREPTRVEVLELLVKVLRFSALGARVPPELTPQMADYRAEKFVPRVQRWLKQQELQQPLLQRQQQQHEQAAATAQGGQPQQRQPPPPQPPATEQQSAVGLPQPAIEHHQQPPPPQPPAIEHHQQQQQLRRFTPAFKAAMRPQQWDTSSASSTEFIDTCFAHVRQQQQQQQQQDGATGSAAGGSAPRQGVAAFAVQLRRIACAHERAAAAHEAWLDRTQQVAAACSERLSRLSAAAQQHQVPSLQGTQLGELLQSFSELQQHIVGLREELVTPRLQAAQQVLQLARELEAFGAACGHAQGDDQQQQQVSTGAAAAAGGGGNRQQPTAASPEERAAGGNDAAAAAAEVEEDEDEDEDYGDELNVLDLLDEDDPVFVELGLLLAAGELGRRSSNCQAGQSAPATDQPQQLEQQEASEGAAVQHDSLAGGRRRKWSCRYRGHVSLKTVKDVAFVGHQQAMVAAGSDDGRMFIFDRHTGALVTALRADRHVVNCVDQSPSAPLLASCGIDATVKLWSPCLGEPKGVDVDLARCLGFNEVERAAVGAASSATTYRGFNQLCHSFSRQAARSMVAAVRADQQAAAHASPRPPARS